MQRSTAASMRSAGITFQYPRADRASCNIDVWLQEQIIALLFQYPRADRASCNSRKRGDAEALRGTFSILVRIEPHAT